MGAITEKKKDDDVVAFVCDAPEEPGTDLDLYDKEKGEDYATELLNSHRIEITKDDLDKFEAHLNDMPIDKAKETIKELLAVHRHDPRYSPEMLARMEMFLEPDVSANPQLYGQLIYEMRIFSLLSTMSSAYAEVRAVASDTDDPTIPSLTLRVWVIGTILSSIGCVINAVFALRYPTISIGANVIQLVCFPIGKAWARFLPDWTILGVRLNPGPFSKKEHLVITMIANLGMAWPPTQHLIFVQAMPQYFNMEYARKPAYQFLGALATNMIGFGFAGITRRFLVYPSYTVWPYSLSTIALNNALHDSGNSNSPIAGPFRRTWRASMYKCFWIVFACYFVYYTFPSYIFPNLQLFDWIAWIKPTNGKLVALTSVNFGMGFGFNPFSTWDLGTLPTTYGVTPMFVLWNFFIGLSVGMLVACAFYFRNVLNCGYLQATSPSTFDHKGKKYKVTEIVDGFGRIIEEKYQQYSEPYMSSTRLVGMIGTFAYTTGTLTHTLLYNRHELKLGFFGFWTDFKRGWQKLRGQAVTAEGEKVSYGDDVHYRIQQAYPEVPEWWFLLVVLVSMLFGFLTLALYTNVSPAVVLIAPIITVIFIIPVGIVTAVSGIEPSLTIISELIGGGIAGGDTMTVQFFRMFGAEPVYHALIYANDLKLSHYVHVPPRDMFWAQMWGGLIGTILTVAQWNWLMKLPDVCNDKAPFRLICPGAQSDYSNFIFWGTLGAPRLFGKGGRYTWLLLGFPLGVAFPVVMFFLKKRFRRSTLLQSSHPLLLLLSFSWLGSGAWGLYIPALFLNWVSWGYLKVRHLEFWTRYNYVSLAAISCAISINALIVFFALVFPGINFPSWWGNPADGQPGCIGAWTDDCRIFKLPAKGYFGPDPGQLH